MSMKTRDRSSVVKVAGIFGSSGNYGCCGPWLQRLRGFSCFSLWKEILDKNIPLAPGLEQATQSSSQVMILCLGTCKTTMVLGEWGHQHTCCCDGMGVWECTDHPQIWGPSILGLLWWIESPVSWRECSSGIGTGMTGCSHEWMERDIPCKWKQK